MNDEAAALARQCEALCVDMTFDAVKKWKAAHPGRPAVGHLPVYAPRELIHAVGGLPVALLGGGDNVDIVKGDACFQSYICHIPRSTVELGLRGSLACLDGVVFPSTCDVIRNLSGIWQMLFPNQYVRYLDLPQSFDDDVGGAFYRTDLVAFAADLEKLGGAPLTPANLARSIELYNLNRQAIDALYQLRADAPWWVPPDEAYVVLRASAVLDVTAHTELVHRYIAAAKRRNRKAEDRVRVMVIGAFCEQPPLGMLRTLDRSGCYVVDDDLFLGAHWTVGEVVPGEDPLRALALSYLHQSTWASMRYEYEQDRGDALVERVRKRHLDGVVFAAPSFCDPALLDQPPLQKALNAANIPFISFKYAENTGQFQGMREQAGTFSDSIKLWGAA